MHAREVTGGREFVARLAYGEDWVEEIAALAAAEDVGAGWFVATGAVEDAELAYYDQDDFAYVTATYEEPLEVASCTGTVALVDGAPEAAVHAVLSRPSGQSVAGRLSAATVFDGELYLRAFADSLDREPDAASDRWLWEAGEAVDAEGDVEEGSDAAVTGDADPTGADAPDAKDE